MRILVTMILTFAIILGSIGFAYNNTAKTQNSPYHGETDTSYGKTINFNLRGFSNAPQTSNLPFNPDRVKEYRIIRNDGIEAIYTIHSRISETYYTKKVDGKWTKPVYVGGDYPSIYTGKSGVFVASSINHQPWVYYNTGSGWVAQKLDDGISTITAINHTSLGIMVVWRSSGVIYASFFGGSQFGKPIVICQESYPAREIKIKDDRITIREEDLREWVYITYKISLHDFWSAIEETQLEKPTVQEKEKTENIIKNDGSALWTYMVYLDEDNSLDGAGYNGDVQEMIQGFNPAANGIVNLIVYDDGRANGDTKIYYVNSTGAHDISGEASWLSSEMDSGNPQTLISFVLWTVQNFPAKHYFLDLWDHGGDYSGAMWDDTSNTHMSLSDLNYAANTIRKQLGFPVDIWGYDACLMNAGADNYEIKNATRIIVASEHTEGDDGWDYKALIGNLTSNPYQGPEEYAYSHVEHVDDEHNGTSIPTMVAINVTRWDYYFIPAYNELAQAIRESAGKENKSIKEAFNNTARADYSYWYQGIDVADFAYNLLQYVNDSKIRYWAERVLENASYSVINYVDKDTGGRKKIMAETSATYEIDGSLSIFAETQWDEMLKQVYANGSDDKNIEPVCNITSPYNGMGFGVNDSITIRGSAWDADGSVKRVEVKVDTWPWKTANGTTAWNYRLNLSHLNPGKHTIFARAYDGDLYSLYASIDIMVLKNTTLPDLVIENMNVSKGEIEEGKTLRINITVANHGRYNASSFNITLYYDSISYDSIIESQSLDRLGVNEEKNLTFTWITTGMAGYRKVIAFVDSQNTVAELNEENNTLTAKIVIIGYSVSLKCERNQSGTQPGGNRSYKIEVINDGTLNDTYNITLQLPSGWMGYLSKSQVKLDPGYTASINLTVFAPENASIGEKGIINVIAQSEGNKSKMAVINITTLINPPILLVDDDGGENYESYFEKSMDLAGWRYNVWDVRTRGSPTLYDMEGYRLLIWSTGSTYDSTLTSSDKGALKSFLNEGGRLYVSSQDLLWDTNDGDNGKIVDDFINNYLGVNSVINDVAYTTIVGKFADPVSGEFQKLSLDQIYTNYADEITPVENATAIFRNYNTNNPVAVRFESGNFKTVFTAFPFEFVAAEDIQYGRDLINNIVVWLLSPNQTNSSPTTPMVKTVHSTTQTGIPLSVFANSTDADEDYIRYQVNWGDGSTTYTTYYPSGHPGNTSHIWIAPGNYSISVRAQDNTGLYSQWSEPITVQVNGSMDAGLISFQNGSAIYGKYKFKGFAYDSSTATYTEIVNINYGAGIYEGPQPIGDVNGDGKNDLLIGGRDGKLHVYEWINGNLVEIANITDPSGKGDNPGGYAIGDLDGDGKNEIAVAWDYDFSAFKWNGNGFSILGNVWTGNGTDNAYDCAIGDINGDGKEDVVIADSPVNNHPEITVLTLKNNTWYELGSWNDPSGNETTPVVRTYDMDGDGRDDIIATPGRDVVLLRWNNGLVAEYIARNLPSETYGITVGKFENTDAIDVAVGLYTPSIHIYREIANGFIEIYNRTWSDEKGILEALDSGDINSDGKQEIIIGTNHVHALEWNGYTFVDVLTINSTDFGNLAVAYAGDINNDGLNEIIVGNVIADPNGEYHLRIFSYHDGIEGVMISFDDPLFRNPIRVNGTNRWYFSYDLSTLSEGAHRIYIKASSGNRDIVRWYYFQVSSEIPEVNTEVLAISILTIAMAIIIKRERSRY